MYPRNSVNEATGATLRPCKKSIHSFHAFLIRKKRFGERNMWGCRRCERTTHLNSWIAATKSKDFNGAAVATTAPSPFLPLQHSATLRPSSHRSLNKKFFFKGNSEKQTLVLG
jgi:hypothetical protein